MAKLTSHPKYLPYRNHDKDEEVKDRAYHKDSDVWVDLAEKCDKYKPVEAFTNERRWGVSCWWCEHYGKWDQNGMWRDSETWKCEFSLKEKERKMKQAIQYEGQQKLLERMNR